MSQWSALVNVKWAKSSPETKDWTWLEKWSEVQSAWSTMGPWDATLWVKLNNPSEVEQFVQDKLWSKDWVANTETHWVKQVWNAA